MKDELNVINLKLDREDDESWRFIGAFVWNSHANKYLHSISAYDGKLGTIRPFLLPEDYDTYFKQFEYCADCDNNTNYEDIDRTVYMVKYKHSVHRNDLNSEDNFHFDCILPTFDDVKQYCKSNEDDYHYIQLKLPFNKNDFFRKIHNTTCEKKRNGESKYWEKVEKEKELTAINTKIIQTNKLVFALLALTLVNFFKTVLY
jgi:hypothetical protein